MRLGFVVLLVGDFEDSLLLFGNFDLKIDVGRSKLVHLLNNCVVLGLNSFDFFIARADRTGCSPVIVWSELLVGRSVRRISPGFRKRVHRRE